MKHNPFSIIYRTPVGAVPEGTTVTLKARLSGDLSRSVFLILIRPGGKTERLAMRRESEWASVSFLCSETGLTHYAFYSDEEGGYCLGPEGKSYGWEPASLWPITVYDAAFTTPAWFCDSVCYQIFPDRFRKSKHANIQSAVAAHEKKLRNVYMHPAWEEEPLWKAREGMKEYVPDDYYGGDLKGIEESLPYLASLGIGSIYLNPIFEADSNHRYNTADYLKIDPLLGTEEDFISLARAAEQYGIRLILDGVFSHTGADSRYFDIKNTYTGGAYHDPDSVYGSWYRFKTWPDTYECWWGFKTLPNVEETNPAYGAFIHGEKGVLPYWQSCGAKGWRLDVADELPESFIREARKRIKSQDPEAILLGEVWEDASDKEGPEGRRTYVDGAELDGCMNYPLRKSILSFLSGKTDAYACENALWSLYTHYPRPFYEACLNLLSSHDEVRALTYLCGAPDRYKADRAEQAAFLPEEQALARGKKLFACATALQMLLPGVPCIYYGDEVGLTGMADPFNRRTFPWGHEDEALLGTVRALGLLRKENRALKNAAAFKMGALSPDVLAVLRFTEADTVLLLINRGSAPRDVVFYPALLSLGPDGIAEVPFEGEYRDLFSGERIKAHSTLQTTLDGFSFRLLIKSGK